MLTFLSAFFIGCDKTKENIIISDGPNNGDSAYELISNVLGRGAIESPDLYDGDHEDILHIYEDVDTVVGKHFVLTMHLDKDGNKGVYEGEVQRNEIKVYDKSPTELKVVENDIFEYRWKFKIDSGMCLSQNFTNFFQLKPVNPESSSPLIRLNASKRDGVDILEVRHKANPKEKRFLCLDSVAFRPIVGEWYQFICKAQFSNVEQGGSFFFDMTSLDGENKVFSLDLKVDMWPGEQTKYVRPKWGIVRSVKNRETLRSTEEKIRLADISIQKLNKTEQL